MRTWDSLIPSERGRGSPDGCLHYPSDFGTPPRRKLPRRGFGHARSLLSCLTADRVRAIAEWHPLPACILWLVAVFRDGVFPVVWDVTRDVVVPIAAAARAALVIVPSNTARPDASSEADLAPGAPDLHKERSKSWTLSHARYRPVKPDSTRAPSRACAQLGQFSFSRLADFCYHCASRRHFHEEAVRRPDPFESIALVVRVLQDIRHVDNQIGASANVPEANRGAQGLPHEKGARSCSLKLVMKCELPKKDDWRLLTTSVSASGELKGSQICIAQGEVAPDSRIVADRKMNPAAALSLSAQGAGMQPIVDALVVARERCEVVRVRQPLDAIPHAPTPAPRAPLGSLGPIPRDRRALQRRASSRRMSPETRAQRTSSAARRCLALSTAAHRTRTSTRR